MNPGFSSTRGVQITMTRFNETKVDSTHGTVCVGAGLTWGQVYSALDPTGVNVIGGRASGVGVAGLTLGGGECLQVGLWARQRAGSSYIPSGYSYKSSQYGLSVDNTVEYELVLPNGTVKYVTSKDKDLWFGLRVSRKTRYRLISLKVSDRREG